MYQEYTYEFVKQNDEPIHIDHVEDEHEEARDFQPSFWWNNRRYYLDDFTRCHNNPWIGITADYPEHIHAFETDNYHHPLFIEIVDDEHLNIYHEIPKLKSINNISFSSTDEIPLEDKISAEIKDAIDNITYVSKDTVFCMYHWIAEGEYGQADIKTIWEKSAVKATADLPSEYFRGAFEKEPGKFHSFSSSRIIANHFLHKMQEELDTDEGVILKADRNHPDFLCVPLCRAVAHMRCPEAGSILESIQMRAKEEQEYIILENDAVSIA